MTTRTHLPNLARATADQSVPPKLKQKKDSLPPYTWTSTSAFFYERFGGAFPGIRSTTWFNGQEAVERLALLLKSPLTFKNSDFGETSPIWWFGRGNLQIEEFRQVDARTVIINFDEYRISRMAAVYSTSYRRLWVYVETEPMSPIGLYPNTQRNLEQASVKGEPYAEEYAIFASQHKITRAEYDDGSAKIGGKIVSTIGDSELRVRHLTPYNFVICSHDSPINNMQFDDDLRQFLDQALVDPSIFQKYADLISRLPISRNP